MDTDNDLAQILTKLRLFMRRKQRSIHKCLVWGATGLTVAKIAGVPLPDRLNWSVVAVMLGFVLMDIADNTYKDRNTKICNSHKQSNKDIAQWLESNRVKRAIFIACTPHLLEHIEQLLQDGAEVTIYLPTREAIRKLGGERQEDLLIRYLHDLYVVFAKFKSTNKLKFRFYSVPPTFHAIRLDDDLLAFGPYIIEHAFDPSKIDDEGLRQRVIKNEFVPHELYNDDPIRLWGHTKPRTVMYRDTPDYYEYNRMLNEEIENFEIWNELNTFTQSPELADMMPDAIKRAHSTREQQLRAETARETASPIPSGNTEPIQVTASGYEASEEKQPLKLGG